jgi:hypothetical protein
MRKTARGRDEATPFYAQLGVVGVVGVTALVVLAIVLPLYFLLGGR